MKQEEKITKLLTLAVILASLNGLTTSIEKINLSETNTIPMLQVVAAICWSLTICFAIKILRMKY